MAAALVSQSEQALVLCQYSEAERCARAALQQAAYLNAERAASLRDRACVVAVQALYETQRFASARKLLRDSFGAALADAPPHTLLLWLALALDYKDSRSEAQSLILSLLDTCQPAADDSSSSGAGSGSSSRPSGSGTAVAPGTGRGWSRRQYLALVHLYAFEVLLPELKDPSEVARWVEETKLPLAPEERQVLLEELEEQRGLLPPPRATSAGLAASAAMAAGADELPQGSGEEEEVDEGWSFQQQQQKGAASSAPAGSAFAAASRRRQTPAATDASEIVPASEEGEYDGDASTAAAAAAAAAANSFVAGLNWLGSCQRQALQAASAILGPLLGLPLQLAPQQQALEQRDSGLSRAGSQQAGSGGAAPGAPPAPAEQLQLLAGGVLGAVLLYAAIAERRAIRDGVGRAQRSVTGGLTDLLRMAFSMSVNPMAVAPR